jgi:hypothetical protein
MHVLSRPFPAGMWNSSFVARRPQNPKPLGLRATHDWDV